MYLFFVYKKEIIIEVCALWLIAALVKNKEWEKRIGKVEGENLLVIAWNLYLKIEKDFLLIYFLLFSIFSSDFLSLVNISVNKHFFASRYVLFDFPTTFLSTKILFPDIQKSKIKKKKKSYKAKKIFYNSTFFQNQAT